MAKQPHDFGKMQTSKWVTSVELSFTITFRSHTPNLNQPAVPSILIVKPYKALNYLALVLKVYQEMRDLKQSNGLKCKGAYNLSEHWSLFL